MADKTEWITIGIVVLLGAFFLSFVLYETSKPLPFKNEVKVVNQTYNVYQKEVVTKEVQVPMTLQPNWDCLEITNVNTQEKKISCKKI